MLGRVNGESKMKETWDEFWTYFLGLAICRVCGVAAVPYFPDYKAHLKTYNFPQKTTVRLIVGCALYKDQIVKHGAGHFIMGIL